MNSEQFIANRRFAEAEKIPGTQTPVSVTIEYSTLGSRLQRMRDGSEPIRKNTVYQADYEKQCKTCSDFTREAIVI